MLQRRDARCSLAPPSIKSPSLSPLGLVLSELVLATSSGTSPLRRGLVSLPLVGDEAVKHGEALLRARAGDHVPRSVDGHELCLVERRAETGHLGGREGEGKGQGKDRERTWNGGRAEYSACGGAREGRCE